MTSNILPLMVIFDLDFTLWPIDVHNDVPQALSDKGEIMDNPTYREGEPIILKYYSEAPAVLDKLKKLNITLAIASKNLMKEANPLLRYFRWDKYFSYREIFPSDNGKYDHLRNLQEKSKVPFSEMILFDNEEPNIKCGKELGIFSIFVDSPENGEGGMNMEILDYALNEYKLLKEKKP